MTNPVVMQPMLELTRRIGELRDDVDIRMESNFDEDLGIDSLRRIDLVIAIEKRFDVIFAESDLVGRETFGALFELVEGVVSGV